MSKDINEAVPFDVMEWCRNIIEGVGGLDDYEKYELVSFSVPDRVAAAEWAMRCLANPKCKGSDRMLQAIMERREEMGE